MNFYSLGREKRAIANQVFVVIFVCWKFDSNIQFNFIRFKISLFIYISTCYLYIRYDRLF